MSDQLKPTGEWTVDGCTVIDSDRKSVFVCDTESGAKHLAGAHNAALSSAKAGGWISQEALDEYAKVEAEHRELREQLADEQEKLRTSRAATNECLRLLDANKEAEIAATEAAIESGEENKMMRDQLNENQSTIQQLAVERRVARAAVVVSVFALVDALKSARKDNDELWTDVTTEWRAKLHHRIRTTIDAALENVKAAR